MRHFENPLLGLEACIDEFDQACRDYETVLAANNRVNVLYPGKFTSNMACAVLNPIGMKYGVFRTRIGVEDLSLPSFGNEGIGDLLKAIGEAIINAIKKFFSWIGSLFGVGGGSGGSGGGSGGGGGGAARKSAREAKEIKIEKAQKKTEEPKPKKSKKNMTAEEITEHMKKSDELQAKINEKISGLGYLGSKIDSGMLLKHIRDCFESAAFIQGFAASYSEQRAKGLRGVLGQLKNISQGAETADQKSIDEYVKNASGVAIDVIKKMMGMFGPVKDQEAISAISRHDGDSTKAAILYQGLNGALIAGYPQKTYENKLLELYFYFGKMPENKKAVFDFQKEINFKEYIGFWTDFRKVNEDVEDAVKKAIMTMKPVLEEIEKFIENYIMKADENSSSVEYFRLFRRVVASTFSLSAGFETFQSHIHHGLMGHGDLIALLAEYDRIPVIEI